MGGEFRRFAGGGEKSRPRLQACPIIERPGQMESSEHRDIQLGEGMRQASFNPVEGLLFV